ncbi:MAG: glycosyltransferase [Candidatus Bathyarchaeota archaeon]|nr:glycosyltransferase [Candidatus Bathyarchaeota archaeon]
MAKTSNPTVSVVITTKNEEKNIDNCLKSIKNQTFKDTEVILVDNYSTDKTAQIAQEHGATVYFKGNERSTQRNFGVNVAQGKYVLYLDADMILSPNLVEKCVEKCKNDGLGALYVPERIVGEGFWIRVRDFERGFYTGTVVDAVRFVRRDLFLGVGGFDECLVGPEDWDFDRKIRKATQTGIADCELYHNEGNFDLKRYLSKKSYYTDGIKRYVDKWGADDAETRRQVGVAYRLLGVFVEDGKWKRLLAGLPFAVGMYYLRFRVSLRYLQKV